MGLGRDIASALDPILVAAGFAAGQGLRPSDEHGEPVGITYCTGHDEFSDRFPWLPQANEYERGGGECIDFIVEVSAEGVVERMDLESFTLAETLLLTGNVDDSRAVANLLGQPSAAMLEHLPGVLQRLFRDKPAR